jgi:pyrroloquinoline quinone biosynthesis protein D
VKPDPAFIPRLAKKARLRFDRHSEKYMLVYPERGLVLNDSAAMIAKKCDGTRTLQQIVDELAVEANVAEAERTGLETDVALFVGELARKGLLEP